MSNKNAKQKRKNHISAQCAHLRYYHAVAAKFFTKQLPGRGSGPSFSFPTVCRISGQVNVELFKQPRSSWEADQLSCS